MEKRLTIKFVKNEIKGEYVEYTILVKDGKNNESWGIKSRYSQLLQLDKRIKEVVTSGTTLPSFPGKKFFGNLDPGFISQRQKALENYFNILLANDQFAKLEVVRSFFYDCPRITSSNNSILKRESTEDEIISRKKTIEKMNNQIKSEKQGVGQVGPIGLAAIIDSINSRFFDLSYALCPPEEEEAKRRRFYYEKLKIDVVNNGNETQLPVGKEENLILIKNDSLVTLNPKLIRDLYGITTDIRKDFDEIKRKYDSIPIVHFISSNSAQLITQFNCQ